MSVRTVDFVSKGNGRGQVELYFTFSFTGKNFAVFRTDGQDCLIDVKPVSKGVFEVLDGTDYDENAVCKVMDILLSNANKNPEKFPSGGCHYDVVRVVRDGKRSYNISKKQPLDYVNGNSESAGSKGGVGRNTSKQKSKGEGDAASVVAIVSDILVKACICTLVAVLGMLIYGGEWVSFYLPSFFDNKTILAYAIVMLPIVIAVPIFIKPFRRNSLFSILAFSSLFFFSGLGGMITNGPVLRCTMTLSIVAALAFYGIALYKSTALERSPTSEELTAPLLSTCGIFAVSVILFSNITLLLLGVDAPLPPITEKESEKIESAYTSALYTVHPSSWEITDERSRLNALQSIADRVCANELGCFVPTLEIISDKEKSTGVIALYSEADKKIFLDAELLRTSSPEAVVKALLTECRLCWQYYIDGMYKSISDTVDKAYLGLETLKAAYEVNRDFKDGDINGGYAAKDRADWTEKKYKDDIQRYILYKNGEEPKNDTPPQSSVQVPEVSSGANNGTTESQPVESTPIEG